MEFAKVLKVYLISCSHEFNALGFESFSKGKKENSVELVIFGDANKYFGLIGIAKLENFVSWVDFDGFFYFWDVLDDSIRNIFHHFISGFMYEYKHIPNFLVC